MAKYYKSKEVKECYCCGGTDLQHVELDPETLDETSDWKQYTTGYRCSNCKNINFTDGEERSYLVTTFPRPDALTKLSGNNTDENWWPVNNNSKKQE